MEQRTLYHHGIKGMKWGVRRYQNKDGSLTPAGKKRAANANNPDTAKRRKDIAKKVAVGSAMALTVTAAAVYYAKHPAVRYVVNSAVNSAGHKTLSALESGSGKAIAIGKKFVSNMSSHTKTAAKLAIQGTKEGIKTGLKEAPKKAITAVLTGVTLNAVKRGLDTAVGKAEAERIMKANNKKKIDSFWKVQEYDDDDD